MVSALVYWGATYCQTYLVGWIGQRALQDLRLRIFRHLQSMPVGFYERRQAGVLISRMTNDVEALAPGEGCYAAFLTHKGKMLGDMRVLDAGGELLRLEAIE